MAKKTQTVVDIEGIEDAGAEPRVYELGFHLDPELPQEEVKKAYQEVRDLISGLGTIVAEGEPTKIPLAYTISRKDTVGRRDFDTAFFCWIAYEADGAGHDAITTMARENVRIIRFLDLRSGVDEAKHSAEMQEMFAQATAQALEDEAAEAEAEAAPAPAPAAEEAA
jgi:ribosomal protein S6